MRRRNFVYEESEEFVGQFKELQFDLEFRMDLKIFGNVRNFVRILLVWWDDFWNLPLSRWTTLSTW